jgi:NAD(P)-dependent dehydrogenase (short-subunit alcohol dehydrogenase family)
MRIGDAAAIVTGGASGLGEATVRAFRAAGAQVTIFDRDTDRGAGIAAETGAHFASVDVTDEASVAAGIAAAKAAMGRITVLVNCAGIGPSSRTVGRGGPHPLDLFRKVVDINLTGTFNVLRLAAAEMAANTPDAGGERGVIVMTASVAAFDGQKGQAAYAASKGGIVGMTLPVARDLGSLGIRVNTIAPGIFLTPMLMTVSEEVRAGLAEDVVHPRRLGDPAEYADLARFMVEAAYLNGETIRLDGGLRMR